MARIFPRSSRAGQGDCRRETEFVTMRYNLRRVEERRAPPTAGRTCCGVHAGSPTRSSTVPRDSMSRVKRETGARSVDSVMPVLPPQR